MPSVPPVKSMTRDPWRFSVTQIGDHKSGEHIAIIEGQSANTLKFSTYEMRDDYTEVKRFDGNIKEDVAQWGADNQLPQRREKLVLENNIVPQLIKTRRDIILGGGIYGYKSIIEGGKERQETVEFPPEFSDFLDATGWDDILECNAGELTKHGGLFTEYVRNKAKTKVARLYSKRSLYMRAGAQDTKGVIRKYFFHGSWKTKDGNKISARAIPAYDADKKQTRFCTYHGDKLFFDGYYYTPAYWGGRQWISTSNQIPSFHHHNLENGYNIRFHIEVPFDYFVDKRAWQAAQSDEAAQKECLDRALTAEQKFVSELNEFLAGAAKSGKTVITKYRADLEKIYPGIKITPIKVDLKDDALLKLYDKSNDANISAQGIHPVLASIQTQGKLSSGSDIRNALHLHLATKVNQERRLLLKPLELVKKINGWNHDFKIGFKDTLLTKLDDDPAGMTSPTEAPATAQNEGGGNG